MKILEKMPLLMHWKTPEILIEYEPISYQQVSNLLEC